MHDQINQSIKQTTRMISPSRDAGTGLEKGATESTASNATSLLRGLEAMADV